MIVGTGIDLCNIERIEKAVRRSKQLFLDRVFTKDEQRRVLQDPSSQQSWRLAKYFAAKEACAKALGTGMRQGVYFRDIYISSFSSGRPKISLFRGAHVRLQSLLPEGYDPVISLSLTDEFPFALAQVMISLRPEGVVFPEMEW